MSKFKIRITRKKIKTNGQCTYSDLDCLFDSHDFSMDKLLKCLDYLYKITFVCSSTLVYLFMSSLFVSSCVFSLRIQIFNQINMMAKFGGLLNTSTNQNLNTTCLKTNEALVKNQVVLSLNEFSSSQKNLDYLLAADQLQNTNDNVLNQNFFNLSAQKCFLNEKFNEFRSNLNGLYDLNRYGLKHRPHIKYDNHLSEFKTIKFINIYHQNFF